jgi:hypothetical protein
MRTRTYTELFALVQALCGVVFSANELGRTKAFINRRAQKAYRATNYWTRFLKIAEGRYLASDPIAATALVANTGYFIATVGDTDFVAIGANANSIGQYFIATAAGTGTGTARPALNYVPYSETGKASVDTFLRIHKEQPYVMASVQEYDFTVTPLGATIVCGNLAPLQAWVTYKAQFTDTYGPGAGFPSGDANDTTTVPAEWFEYLAHGAYADYLRAEGQQERAVVADQEADLILQDELMRLDEQHTQTLISNRIFTNSNMQLRW